VQIADAIFGSNLKFVSSLIALGISLCESSHSVERLVDIADIVDEESEVEAVAKVPGNST
jgi:hypothetical protein